MMTLWHKSLSKTAISKTGKLLIFDILWIIYNKIEKYRKVTKKMSFRKRFNVFSTEGWLQNTLLIVINIHIMLLNGTVWIIMKHPRS